MFAKLKSRAVVIGLVCLAVGGARAEPTDSWVQEYVVQILWGPERDFGGSGVYLGKGLVITAAHVVGPQSRTVGIDGVSLAARLIKGGGDPDLSLLSMDERTLPTSLLERRMPLCQEQPPVGAPVILGAVRGITRTSIASPMWAQFGLVPPPDGEPADPRHVEAARKRLAIELVDAWNVILRDEARPLFSPIVRTR